MALRKKIMKYNIIKDAIINQIVKLLRKSVPQAYCTEHK